MSVVLEKDGQQQKIMENVSTLEVTAEGIRISTLFEQPKILTDTHLKKIDFLDGIVVLQKD